MCIHCLIAILVSRQGQWKPRSGWRNRAVKFGYLVKTGQFAEARTYAKSVQTQKLTDSFWNVWTHDLLQRGQISMSLLASIIIDTLAYSRTYCQSSCS